MTSSSRRRACRAITRGWRASSGRTVADSGRRQPERRGSERRDRCRDGQWATAIASALAPKWLRCSSLRIQAAPVPDHRAIRERTKGNRNITIAKSGTNAFHGAAWEYHTNSQLKARNYFYCLYSCSGDPNTPPKNLKIILEVTLGGPIKQNKLFFFADWERTTRRQAASALRMFPTAALRGGDFIGTGGRFTIQRQATRTAQDVRCFPNNHDSRPRASTPLRLIWRLSFPSRTRPFFPKLSGGGAIGSRATTST